MERVQSPGFALLVFSVSCRVFAAPSGDGSTLSTLTLLSRGNDAEMESPIASLSEAFLTTGVAATPTVSSATFTEQVCALLCCLVAGAWAAAAPANSMLNKIAAASRPVVGWDMLILQSEINEPRETPGGVPVSLRIGCDRATGVPLVDGRCRGKTRRADDGRGVEDGERGVFLGIFCAPAPSVQWGRVLRELSWLLSVRWRSL